MFKEIYVEGMWSSVRREEVKRAINTSRARDVKWKFAVVAADWSQSALMTTTTTTRWYTKCNTRYTCCINLAAIKFRTAAFWFAFANWQLRIYFLLSHNMASLATWSWICDDFSLPTFVSNFASSSCTISLIVAEACGFESTMLQFPDWQNFRHRLRELCDFAYWLPSIVDA